MGRKITRKGLVKKLDKLVSEIVVLRDGECVVCGSKHKLGCGHLFSRVAYSTRWDLLNCHAQCWPCNYRHEYDPYPFTKYFLKKYGQNRLDKLHKLFRTAKPVKMYHLEAIREQLEAILKELKD